MGVDQKCLHYCWEAFYKKRDRDEYDICKQACRSDTRTDSQAAERARKKAQKTAPYGMSKSAGVHRMERENHPDKYSTEFCFQFLKTIYDSKIFYVFLEISIVLFEAEK